MTKIERNIRTLIVCFVILMAALVPLRFLEVSQHGDDIRILGESVDSGIQLPNAELNLDSGR